MQTHDTELVVVERDAVEALLGFAMGEPTALYSQLTGEGTMDEAVEAVEAALGEDQAALSGRPRTAVMRTAEHYPKAGAHAQVTELRRTIEAGPFELDHQYGGTYSNTYLVVPDGDAQ